MFTVKYVTIYYCITLNSATIRGMLPTITKYAELMGRYCVRLREYVVSSE